MKERTRTARYAGIWTLVLLLAGCLGDDNSVAGPQVSFTNLGNAKMIQTPDIVVNIVGTATSDIEIEKVDWINDRGGRGSANGKETWVTGNIVLQVGTNNITVTATDVNGDSNSKSIAVEREAQAAASSAEIPQVLYSYKSDLSNPAPVRGASIIPGQVYFFFEPSTELKALGIDHVGYLCCKGISGPGEGTPFDPVLTVSNVPWSIGMNLSGLEKGGTRRLRSDIFFKDGSDYLIKTYDFTVAGAGATNRLPAISGSPPTSATAGVGYSFQPTATDADGDSLIFSISNKPSWASFDRTSGRLSGTPKGGDVGIHSNIIISVSDGQASTKLKAFSITVAQNGNGSATLTWDAPTQRIDNTPLTDLAGYVIYVGQTARSYPTKITVKNPGLTAYVVDNLSSGNWYFAVSAFDSSGQHSDWSNEGQINIP